jgi:four helix bundle protein
MPTVTRFEDLHCWQEARKLVKATYDISNKNKFSKDYDLKSQIRRSAISVMANIAEGFHRKSNKDFRRFLDYSRASLAETISHCYVALDQGYITGSELKEINETAEITWKMINKFMTYLK